MILSIGPILPYSWRGKEATFVFFKDPRRSANAHRSKPNGNLRISCISNDLICTAKDVFAIVFTLQTFNLHMNSKVLSFIKTSKLILSDVPK